MLKTCNENGGGASYVTCRHRTNATPSRRGNLQAVRAVAQQEMHRTKFHVRDFEGGATMRLHATRIAAIRMGLGLGLALALAMPVLAQTQLTHTPVPPKLASERFTDIMDID